MLFDSWQGLVRVAVVGVLAYIGLVVLLRVSGNRTLSKLSAFDLIVTVALGSTLATVVLTKDVALVEGLLAFALLVGLQFVVTWLSVRSETVARIVKTDPVLLFHRGRYLQSAMRRARVTAEEVRAALRSEGVADTSCVRAVVLESDGTMSVLREEGGAGKTLQDVEVPNDSVKLDEPGLQAPAQLTSSETSRGR
jgi:uncharacterized membrane protein YcaP (DUF421 family)